MIRGIELWLAIALGLAAAAPAAGQDQPPSEPAREGVVHEENPLAERLGLKTTIELRGRIEADAVMAVQSAASRAQIGDLQNAFGFRRARIGAQGTVGDSSRWVAEIDFANGIFRARDLFVGLTALPGVREVDVGYFREPFSLEGATSSRFITFMERSTLNALDPARNWGVAGHWRPESERYTFAIGAFRTGTTDGGLSIGDDGNWAVTTRVTALPVYHDDDWRYRLIHVGAAFSQRRPPGGIVDYDPGPQSNLLDVSDSPVSPLLPRLEIASNSGQLFNLQAAAVDGSFSVQGEWFATTIQQRDAGLVFLHGFYIYASYFLTGEHRGYDRAVAGFGPVRVHRPVIRSEPGAARGWGALELAARFSAADFSSNNLPPMPTPPPVLSPTGTVLYEGTLGVNWYLNDHTRVMVNYVLSAPVASGVPTLPIHGFGIRTAIYW
jgi:phosphate-selective porin OprO/OprP